MKSIIAGVEIFANGISSRAWKLSDGGWGKMDFFYNGLENFLTVFRKPDHSDLLSNPATT